MAAGCMATWESLCTAPPKDTVFFDCPVDCKRLYFVVSGGPKKYWRQVWDDNDANDEQWPYQVKFGNTNRYGSANLPDETGIGEVAMDASVPVVSVSGRTLRVEPSPVAAEVRVAALSGVCVADLLCGASAVETPLSPRFLYRPSVVGRRAQLGDEESRGKIKT